MTILHDLSDEQLDQYARLADDQMRREDRFAWAQVAVGILAIATLAWALLSAVQGSLDRARLTAAAMAGMTLYWPYRKAKARGIWRSHIEATREEQERRVSASSKGSGGAKS